jgi:hypothetical protein
MIMKSEEAYYLESVKKNYFNSLDNLNELRHVIDFLNLDTEVMLASSQIWVETGKIGKQTADNYNIEVDIRLSYFLCGQFNLYSSDRSLCPLCLCGSFHSLTRKTVS